MSKTTKVSSPERRPMGRIQLPEITTRRCRRGGQFVRIWMIGGREYDFVDARDLLTGVYRLRTEQAHRLLFQGNTVSADPRPEWRRQAAAEARR